MTTNNIIDVSDPADWFTMNMLKRSIKFMKNINKEGKYDIAIHKEEAILRSFFDKALASSSAASTAAVAA